MKFTLTAISILLALASFSCRQKEQGQKEQQSQQQQQHVQTQQGGIPADLHTVVVQEVIQASSYTYLKVKETESEFWIAITKRQIEAGETISFSGALEMKNFQSKDLQRTFETIYFVARIVGDESSAPQQPASMSHGEPELEKKVISIEPAEGGITIAELFTNRDSYGDKTVLIKGQVTKVNRAIMDRNWVHLQDGTGDSGSNDLTVTTNEQVNVGDVVTFEGKITLNKDFGSGYSYEVLMEQAKLKTQ